MGCISRRSGDRRNRQCPCQDGVTPYPAEFSDASTVSTKIAIGTCSLAPVASYEGDVISCQGGEHQRQRQPVRTRRNACRHKGSHAESPGVCVDHSKEVACEAFMPGRTHVSSEAAGSGACIQGSSKHMFHHAQSLYRTADSTRSVYKNAKCSFRSWESASVEIVKLAIPCLEWIKRRSLGGHWPVHLPPGSLTLSQQTGTSCCHK